MPRLSRTLKVGDADRNGYLQVANQTDDAELAMLSCNEEFAEVQAEQEKSHRRHHIKLRVGMVFAVAALLGVAYQVTQWKPENATTHAGSEKADQQTVAKFVDPCAPVTTPTPICAPFNGQFFASSKACCAASCGTFCGASNCQLAPAGYENCCTGNFSALCGSAQAPCLLPRTLEGTLQLLVDNLPALANNPNAVAAIKAALAAALGVPVADLSASFAAAGGRRLLQEAVNVGYEIRLPPTSTKTPAEVTAASPSLLPLLQTQFTAANITVSVLEAELPTPVVSEPGTPATAVTAPPVPPLSTTTPPPTTTPQPTSEFMGLITISTNATQTVLESADSRKALAHALAEVFGINATAVTVLGESDGSGNTIRAGYDVTLPDTITAAMVQASGSALVAALQAQFNTLGVAATVYAITFGTPREITTTTTTLAYNVTYNASR